MIRTLPTSNDLTAFVPAIVAGQSPQPIRFSSGDLYMDSTETAGYRFVRCDPASAALVAGQGCYWQSDAFAQGKRNGLVTATAGPPAGVALSAIPPGGWGFIQVRGRGTGGWTAAGVAAGAALMLGAAGLFLTHVAGNPIVGTNQGGALSAAGGTSAPLYFQFE